MTRGSTVLVGSRFCLVLAWSIFGESVCCNQFFVVSISLWESLRFWLSRSTVFWTTVVSIIVLGQPKINSALLLQSNVLEPKFVLNLWCMNPGIMFKQLTDRTYSVILTSGTLSPMASFEKELNCKFHSTLEAPHVVTTDQTLLASIGQGPMGFEMQAIYKNTSKLAFQDELGRILLDCCKVVLWGVCGARFTVSLVDRAEWSSLLLVFVFPVGDAPRTLGGKDFRCFVD